MSTAVLDAEVMQQSLAAAPIPLINAGAVGSPVPWFQQLQSAAWDRFSALPMPARTDECWRFANLKRLQLGAYLPAQACLEVEELIARSVGIPAVAGRMIFANDHLLRQETTADSLRQKGVLWLPLAEAIRDYPELVKKYFMREGAILGSEKFAALHQSQVRAGTFLYVPRGVEIDLPIETYHWLAGAEGSCFPHTLIVAEDQSKVTLVDYFQSASEEPGLACGVNDLWLGAGSQVTYVCAQNWSRQVQSFQINSTVVGRDARALMLNLNLGSASARTESVSRLSGPGGRSDMLAVSVADETQELDQRTLQIHEVPHTASDLLYKNSLDDQARTIFAGLIRVDPGAHQTDAYQKVRNLLLSDESEANSAPGLEIEADDVRCTHGATTGQIDSEELFYLLSRGITKKEAQKLIVHGFLGEVIDRLGNEAIANKLSEWVHLKFDAKMR